MTDKIRELIIKVIETNADIPRNEKKQLSAELEDTLKDYKVFKRKELDTVFFNREKVMKYFFKEREQLIIFDIGSHMGESITKFKEIFPFAKIHGFEPDSSSYNKLKEQLFANNDIIINNVGVGDKNTKLELKKYYISSNNSFKEINADSFSIKNNVHPKVSRCLKESHETELCDVITIDQYIKKTGIQSIDLMKVDVQGFEREVLLGCEGCLKKNTIGMIVIEITFDDVYGGGNMFSDIENIIRKHGYSFWDISHIYKDLERQRTCWVDAVYVSHKRSFANGKNHQVR